MFAQSTSIVFTLLALLSITSAHLTIKHPVPIRFNETGGVEKYTVALRNDGTNFPCKKVFKIGTNEGIGPSMATWKAGEMAHFELHDKGVAAHWGGSCQAGISYDYGKTFQVIRSFVGGCPKGAQENKILPNNSQRYDFQIPTDAPGGPAIFAWTWFPVTGFRDMYMNCAHITIQQDKPIAAKKLNETIHPPMFVGNIVHKQANPDNCTSVEWFNMEFPKLGPSPVYGTNTRFAFRTKKPIKKPGKEEC